MSIVARKCLIIGAGGQDGILLSSLMSRARYEVHALLRNGTDSRALCTAADEAVVHRGSIGDQNLVIDLLSAIKPVEIYNLAAQSSVAESWHHPFETLETNVNGVLHLLEAIRHVSGNHYQPRLYQASSSEMFGKATDYPQNESTRYQPVSPYGTSKVAAHHLVQTYRESYGIHGSCGILFNHESPLRPERFVTRKVTIAAANIKLGHQETLRLGDLQIRRDWGSAGDYVEAMWRMLQQDAPGDFVVATGASRSLRDFVATAFEAAGVIDWRERVVVDRELSRPAEVVNLVGDASKARNALGWSPQTSFETMIAEMVEHDLALARKGEFMLDRASSMVGARGNQGRTA